MEETFSTEEMFFCLKKIGLHLSAQMELSLKNENMTGVQVYFLAYILRHHPEGTYLTELYQETGVSKPTLSALIKKLKEKGYLAFQAEPDDVRKKKVVPTGKLREEAGDYLKKVDQMEKEICSAFDPQEKKSFWDLEQKLITQFARMERNMDHEKNRQEVYQP